MIDRHELHQQAIDALLESNAIDFEAVSKVIATLGSRFVKEGVDFSVILGHRAWDICIPPDPFRGQNLVREFEGRAGAA